jgi:hypothetical protein
MGGGDSMRRFCLVYAAGSMILAFAGLAQQAPAGGPYGVSKTVKVCGAGTFDTALADTVGRRLYIPRKAPGRITVFNLDTLERVGEIPDAIPTAPVSIPASSTGDYGNVQRAAPAAPGTMVPESSRVVTK